MALDNGNDRWDLAVFLFLFFTFSPLFIFFRNFFLGVTYFLVSTFLQRGGGEDGECLDARLYTKKPQTQAADTLIDETGEREEEEEEAKRERVQDEVMAYHLSCRILLWLFVICSLFFFSLSRLLPSHRGCGADRDDTRTLYIPCVSIEDGCINLGGECACISLYSSLSFSINNLLLWCSLLVEIQ